jgi:uridine phosphorylase
MHYNLFMSFKSSSAAKPEAEGLQYHIRLKKGDIPPYVLTPGDPKRVNKIAALWDSNEEVVDYREFHTMKGDYHGAKLACTSTGIGAPAAAIVLEELARIGTKTIIRTGTCGSIAPELELGDLVISTGAVRLEGASKEYVMPEYPAIADFKVVGALIAAAKKLKVKYHVGITATTDTFYCGQGRPGFADYLPSHKVNLFKDLQKAKVKSFDMEGSCILTLSSLFGMKAGMICVVVADRVRDTFKLTDEMEQKCALVASEAIRILQK